MHGSIFDEIKTIFKAFKILRLVSGHDDVVFIFSI